MKVLILGAYMPEDGNIRVSGKVITNDNKKVNQNLQYLGYSSEKLTINKNRGKLEGIDFKNSFYSLVLAYLVKEENCELEISDSVILKEELLRFAKENAISNKEVLV